MRPYLRSFKRMQGNDWTLPGEDSELADSRLGSHRCLNPFAPTILPPDNTGLCRDGCWTLAGDRFWKCFKINHFKRLSTGLYRVY
jgi:hypothetical protein